jgi:hypothetical protein
MGSGIEAGINLLFRLIDLGISREELRDAVKAEAAKQPDGLLTADQFSTLMSSMTAAKINQVRQEAGLPPA